MCLAQNPLAQLRDERPAGDYGWRRFHDHGLCREATGTGRENYTAHVLKHLAALSSFIWRVAGNFLAVDLLHHDGAPSLIHHATTGCTREDERRTCHGSAALRRNGQGSIKDRQPPHLWHLHGDFFRCSPTGGELASTIHVHSVTLANPGPRHSIWRGSRGRSIMRGTVWLTNPVTSVRCRVASSCHHLANVYIWTHCTAGYDGTQLRHSRTGQFLLSP